MKRSTAILIVAVMLVSALPIVSENADGFQNDLFYSQSNIDGFLDSNDGLYDGAYNGTGNLTAYTTNNSFYVGQHYDGTSYYCWEGHVSFDTSDILSSEKVVSSTLWFRVEDCAIIMPGDYFTLNVNRADFGTLTTADWNTTGIFEGSTDLQNYADGVWMFVDVSPSRVNKTGNSQYQLRSDDQEWFPVKPTAFTRHYATIYSGDSDYKPYLSVTTITDDGAIITYNYTTPGMTNETTGILPVEIINYGTYDLYRYEFMSFNETYLNFSIDADFTYEGISPPCSVIDYGTGYFNITNTHDDSFHWIWFSHEFDMTTKIFISPFHHTKYDGLDYNLYRIYINTGSWYDPGNAARVFYPEYEVATGVTYVLTCLDYAGNMITNYSFIATGRIQFIDFPIPIWQLNINNLMSEDIVDFRIWFNAVGNPYNDHVSPGKLYPLAVQNGSYMFAFTRLRQTADLSYTNLTVAWYNLTLNGTYTVNIGESGISIIYTTVLGMSMTVNTFGTWITPDKILEPIDPITATCQAIGGTGDLIYLDPWLVIWGNILIGRNDNSTGSKTVWGGDMDTTTMQGTIVHQKDVLRVAGANTSARIMVNDTDLGTNIINATVPPGYEYNILQDYSTSRGNNLTVWVQDGALSVIRDINFRWSQLFDWYYQPSNNILYTAVVQVNNTMDYRVNKPVALVAFANDTIPRDVAVYDIDNMYYLDDADGFTVDDSGVSFEFLLGYIDPGTQRNFRVEYYGDELPWPGDGWIWPEQAPQWKSWDNTLMRYVYGTYKNGGETTFVGRIAFIFDDEEVTDINPSSIVVVELSTGYVISNKPNWKFTGGEIGFSADYIGEIPPGESVGFGIYYLTDEDVVWDVLSDPAIGPLSLPVFFLIIAFGLMAFGHIMSSSNKDKRATYGREMRAFGIAILIMLISAVLLIVLISS